MRAHMITIASGLTPIRFLGGHSCRDCPPVIPTGHHAVQVEAHRLADLPRRRHVAYVGHRCPALERIFPSLEEEELLRSRHEPRPRADRRYPASPGGYLPRPPRCHPQDSQEFGHVVPVHIPLSGQPIVSRVLLHTTIYYTHWRRAGKQRVDRCVSVSRAAFTTARALRPAS